MWEKFNGKGKSMEIRLIGTTGEITEFIKRLGLPGRVEVTVRESERGVLVCTPITTASNSASETES